jgi:hypothetical protein
LESDVPQYDRELGLNDDALMRIAASVGAPLEQKYLIHAAAILYWGITDQGSKATGRGTKADLRRAAKDIKRAADALENLPLQTTLFASLADVDGRVVETEFLRRQRVLLPELRWMQDLMENWGALRRRAIPDMDLPMSTALSFLDNAYLAMTGQQPTHSYHRDCEYTGRPISRFGRFVVAFFNEVDPSRSETSLSTSIRSHMADKREKLVP